MGEYKTAINKRIIESIDIIINEKEFTYSGLISEELASRKIYNPHLEIKCNNEKTYYINCKTEQEAIVEYPTSLRVYT